MEICVVLCLFIVTLCSSWAEDVDDFRLVTYDDLRNSIDRFTHSEVSSYTELLFDVPRYQLIVGAKDYLFRLSLEGLRKLEEAHWPAAESTVTTCKLKGKTKEECQNFIRVLLYFNNKIFTCGTNAFSPECTWRDITALNTVTQWVTGIGKCPYSPYYNSTSLMTSQGSYYIASPLDFSAQDYAIYRIMGKGPYLRTVQYDPKWLNKPNFVASFEIGNFTYFFFREPAVEFINCGKIVYSRIARICTNDQGGQYMLKDKWTTFLKAQLNCSIPGNYPFYYNEIQSVHYLEREQMIYATFNTPDNSIYGSAVCSFNISSIHKAFNGPFKHQANPKSTWEKHTNSHTHFQCDMQSDAQHLLDSERFQLMDQAVQPSTINPLFTSELERLSHIVVDIVPTKHHDGIHVIFVANIEGIIKKLVVVPNTQEACLVEKIELFPKNQQQHIYVLKLLRDTSSLYIGTDSAVLRIPLHRCEKFRTRSECLNAMDPYCGWNEYQLACTTAPNRNPLSAFWEQDTTTCPRINRPVDGAWSSWSNWFECSQIGKNAPGDKCLCRQRHCNNPKPVNGGKDCDGDGLQVSNCTQNGQWTEWSSWSSCSQTCGLSVKMRRRTCGNPSPKYGGRVCLGPERDEIYCTSNPPCPVPAPLPIDGQWSEWSSWEECSSICGGGIQTRRRRCNNPPPQHGGQECIGCHQDFKICNSHRCAESRKSTGWTPWLKVNYTKDGFFEQRFRFTCRANVPNESMIRIGHMKKEERFCLEGSQNCLDAAFVNIDGEWSEWSTWSRCSVSCGGGVQKRERFCDNPRPTGTGSNCSGHSRAERTCNTNPCSDGWEEWSIWSLCDQNLEQHRRRKCLLASTSPIHCQGPNRETRICLPSQADIIIPGQSKQLHDDGIHAEHVIAACFCSFFLGFLVAAVAVYQYMKRNYFVHHPRLASRMIQVKPNTYVSEMEWKNNLTPNGSPGKFPLREASIKRNGQLRAQIDSDHNF